MTFINNERAAYLKHNYIWIEGLTTTQVLVSVSGLRPEMYWIEAKSYIWDANEGYIVVSEDFCYKHRLVSQKPSLHFEFGRLILLGKL